MLTNARDSFPLQTTYLSTPFPGLIPRLKKRSDLTFSSNTKNILHFPNQQISCLRLVPAIPLLATHPCGCRPSATTRVVAPPCGRAPFGGCRLPPPQNQKHHLEHAA